MDKKFIHSGQLIVAKSHTEIHTVLGSCVAVCLYDPTTQISGLNHYLLPFWNNDGLMSPKYGNISIPKLIEEMEKVGCKKQNIIAKVFGGANQYNLDATEGFIGDRNFKVAEKILTENGIKIVAKDVGGQNGRKVVMDSKTGKIKMRYVQKVGDK